MGINLQISKRKGVSYRKKKKKKTTAKGFSLYQIEKMAEQLLSNVAACSSRERFSVLGFSRVRVSSNLPSPLEQLCVITSKYKILGFLVVLCFHECQISVLALLSPFCFLHPLHPLQSYTSSVIPGVLFPL